MKLIKKLYSEDCQSIVSEAIEGLEVAPIGSSATDDAITVTKTGDKDYQVTDNTEVVLMSVGEGDEISSVEAEAQYCQMVDGKMTYSAPAANSGTGASKMKFNFSEGTAAPGAPGLNTGDEVEVVLLTQTLSGTVKKLDGDTVTVELNENSATPILEVKLPKEFVNVKKVKVFSAAKKFAPQA